MSKDKHKLTKPESQCSDTCEHCIYIEEGILFAM